MAKFNPVKFVGDMIPYAVGGLGVYETYLFATNTPPYFQPDPLYDFIKTNIIPLLPKYTPPTPSGNCPAGQHKDANNVCVPDALPACPTGQHRDGAGNCVADITTCTAPTTAPAGSPLTTVTIDAPVAESSVQAGTTLMTGGTIPAGVNVSRIGVRLLKGTDQSFTLQDWVEMITWIEKLSPVTGPWNISMPIPASIPAGRYLVGCHIIGTDCTAYWPYKWVNITAATTPNPNPNPNPTPDTTAPTVAFTSPVAGGTVTAGVTQGFPNTIQGTASDAVGVAQVKIWVGTTTPVIATISNPGAGTVSWTASWNFIAVGTHTIHAQATDNAGNVSADTTIQVQGVAQSGVGDTIKPTIAITSPAAGANVTSNLITVTGTANDNIGVAEVRVRPRLTGTTATAGYILATPAAPGDWSTWSVPINLYKQGAVLGDVHGTSYDLVARVLDNAGNQAFATITVNCASCTSTPVPPVCATGTHLDTVTNTCVPDALPPTQGSYEATFNLATPAVGTINNGQTVTYAPTIPPYPTMIAESNEPAQYQGDMQCDFSINGGPWIPATRVSTLTDQWRLTIPNASTTWHNGANTMIIRFTYINGWVKQGSIGFTVTGASAYARAYNVNSNRFIFRGGRFGSLINPYVYRNWS